jgi:hypothetical protein
LPAFLTPGGCFGAETVFDLVFPAVFLADFLTVFFATGFPVFFTVLLAVFLAVFLAIFFAVFLTVLLAFFTARLARFFTAAALLARTREALETFLVFRFLEVFLSGVATGISFLAQAGSPG